MSIVYEPEALLVLLLLLAVA